MTSSSAFCRFDLRTTDAVAARAFYTRVFGHDRMTIWPLHEQALARGARPHWLGRIAVEDLEATAIAFVERGAERFGPTIAMSDGGKATVLRDPGGAVVAVGTPPEGAAAEAARGGASDVVWYVLNTRDAARALATYGELFGWSFGEPRALGAHGTFRELAWRAGAESAGMISDIADRPGVHPHWLFCFETASLTEALATVRAAGGLALDPVELPNGARLAVCDDPQGAAFGLIQIR